VRSVCAILLLVLFGFPLIVPEIRAESEPKLHACCLRGGKHHCAEPSQETSGPSVREKCPDFPGASALPAFSNTILLNASQAYFSEIVKHPAIHPQTDALQRISFSRSRQKRGPPALIS
jgi:hypothetical protein